MSGIAFESGSFFTLIVVTVIGLTALFLLLRRQQAGLFPLPVFLLRLLTLLLVLAAAARPYTETTTESSRAMLLVDISESMDEVVAEQLLKKAQELAANEIDVAMLPFAVKIKTWDIVGLETFFSVIDASKIIQLSL